MRGPIDYIVVGFEGNKFDGSVMQALADAIEQGVIGLVALAVVSKDADGAVTKLDIAEAGDDSMVAFVEKYQPSDEAIASDDIDEVADLVENNCTAGLLVIEQLWAKPLKKALLDAKGVLVAEGRIHPDAVSELEG
jgi:hypothetical protein